ncbi:hypothetical protein R3P38DRAFT_3214382 [Favolaschia claudopus]|uniref:Uncharacterized protein n=1 Tax=Favolaschia claudopus TaxID=2862362 RepID=A0AAW0AB01_9AGAR
MSAYWPDWVYIYALLHVSKGRGAYEGFSCSVVLLRVRRGCSNGGVLPRPDTLAGSSRKSQSESSSPTSSLDIHSSFQLPFPAPLVSIDTHKSIDGAGINDVNMLSVHPSFRRTSASTFCRPAPPRPHHPRLISLYPACPHLRPSLTSVLRSLSPPNPTAPPHPAPHLRLFLPAILRTFPRSSDTCAFKTTLGKWFLWAGD